jgi:hypothetical protein
LQDAALHFTPSAPLQGHLPQKYVQKTAYPATMNRSFTESRQNQLSIIYIVSYNSDGKYNFTEVPAGCLGIKTAGRK